jgi:hypothetical protein
MMQRKENSPAFKILRSSTQRLLMYCEQRMKANGGSPVALFDDEIACVGSRRVYVSGFSELNALGLLKVARSEKQWLVQPSDHWKTVTAREAMLASCRIAARDNADAPAETETRVMT